MTVKGKEVFVNPDGTLYHLGLKAGQLNPRILTVGERGRAQQIADAFLKDVRVYDSRRDFLTFSGDFRGTPISIVCIGMGSPNMDFLVKESSVLLQGRSLAIVRLGTCGILKPDLPVGTFILGSDMYTVYRNYIHWDGDALNPEHKDSNPYYYAGPVSSDKELTDMIEAQLKEKGVPHYRGAAASAETFYSCQGRSLDEYDDKNADIIPNLKKIGCAGFEMESHQLIHLCHQRQHDVKGNGILTRASSLCIGIVNRESDLCDHIDDDKKKALLLTAAEACMLALAAIPL